MTAPAARAIVNSKVLDDSVSARLNHDCARSQLRAGESHRIRVMLESIFLKAHQAMTALAARAIVSLKVLDDSTSARLNP